MNNLSNSNPEISGFLTGIFIKESDGNFTAFFSEIPEASAQGETQEEAERNLFDILPDVLEFKNDINNEEKAISGISSDSITRKSYNLHIGNYSTATR